MLRKGGCLPHPEVAERVNGWWQYSSETNCIFENVLLSTRRSHGRRTYFES